MSASAYLHTTPYALYEAVGNDGAAFGTLARMYLEHSAAALTRWQALSAGCDSGALAALCHEMRSSAVLLGAAALAAQLTACEARARCASMPAPARLAAVEAELAQVESEVRRALAQFARARLAPPRILVVDDDALSRDLLRLQLVKAGCHSDEAADGAAALAALQLQRYHMVLLDVQMPVLDGYHTAAAWRRQERPQAPRLCIIGLSAAGVSAQPHWQAAGMDGLLCKPLHPAGLGALLERWLGWPTGTP